MTKQERIIVSAYTGVSMCDFGDIHGYIEEKLGRPIWTHEFVSPELQKYKRKQNLIFSNYVVMINNKKAVIDRLFVVYDLNK